MRPIFSVVMAGALVLSGGSVQADVRDPAAAQALFSEGKKLMGAGRYADACPKLEESDRLDPAIGTKFNLADCEEHLGRSASAWAEFLAVAVAAKNAGQPPRERAARERAKALEAKLSRIAVVVPDATRVPGLEVERDGEIVGTAVWGEAIPVDPGEHTLIASAPGKRGWKTIVEVAPAGGSAKVIIPPLDDEPAVVAETPLAPSPAPVTPVSAADSPAGAASAGSHDRGWPSSASSTAPTAGWVLLGAGAVAAIGGGVFWAMTSNEISILNGKCNLNGGRQCPSSAQSDISTGRTYDAISVTLFTVGGAAVLTGAGLVLFGGRGEHGASGPARRAPVRLRPMLGGREHRAGLEVIGEF